MLGLPPEREESSASSTTTSPEEMALVLALRRGDEAAFVTLVERYHAALVHVALPYVSDRTTAEEVAQETWLGVLQGLDRFEGRSSLKTWIFRILLNTAKTRGVRERRSIPFSSFEHPDDTADEPSVDPSRFLPADHPKWPHHWAIAPDSWADLDDVLASRIMREYVERAIEALAPAQREVITLRDIEGWTSEEVCQALGISEGNQRVLLHRARSKVRQAMADYLGTN
ncbi:MAG: sigma-70 family RNA polymerase sigma factor [Anaerolineae bacterium]